MFNNDWDIVLKDLLNKDSIKELFERVNKEYENSSVFPCKEDLFLALKNCSYEDTKVVIIGQDPYFNKDQAMGLAFSVRQGKLPSSLLNIYKELYKDYKIDNSDNGNLTKWSKQGVLLLNTVLTVEEGKPDSHKDIGWQEFTDEIIRLLNKKDKPIVFNLWGNKAQEKIELITNPIHHIIKLSHPSGLSYYRSFQNGQPFKNTNDFLRGDNQKEIDWNLKV